MTDARDKILNRLRRRESLYPASLTPAQWMSETREQAWPEFEGTLADTFIERASAASATVESLPTKQDLNSRIQQLIDDKDAQSIYVSPASASLLNTFKPFKVGTATSSTQLSIVTAFAGVAETGSLVFRSNQQNPNLLHFLAEKSYVILSESDLLARQEDVWQKLKQDKLAMSRSVVFVTGPSRTADIEQTIQLGAHGPRELTIWLLKSN